MMIFASFKQIASNNHEGNERAGVCHFLNPVRIQIGMLIYIQYIELYDECFSNKTSKRQLLVYCWTKSKGIPIPHFYYLIGEKMNKNIIIAILVVIIIAAGAALMLGHQQNANGKEATQINFLSKSSLQNGEQIQFQLKDAKGNALSGENVNMTFNNNEKYTITTDQDGKGYLTISGEDAGTYDFAVAYAGNDKYDGCDAKTKITIEEGEADEPAQDTNTNATANSATDSSNSGNGNSNSSNQTQGFNGVDEGIQVDENGIIHSDDSQYDGMSMDDYIRWQEDPNGYIENLE